MKRLLLIGVAALMLGTSSGCCLLDSLLCWHHNWGCCGGWGCEMVPHASCASQRTCCEPCDCCGQWSGPPHDYGGLGQGGDQYMSEPVWEEGGVIQQGQPTPAETVPPPPRSTRRLPPTGPRSAQRPMQRPVQRPGWY